MRDQILILNFDNSYSAAIASKLRAERISARILAPGTSAESIMNEEALGVILSGGISPEQPQDFDGRLLRYGIPVLALGSATAVVASLLGAQVGEARSINEVDTLIFQPSRITDGLGESERMFGTVRPLELTDDLQPLAAYEGQTIGFSHKTLEIYGINCQLEPNDPDMMSLIMQFATDVCGCTRWWGEDAFITIARNEIQEAAGEGKAVCVMSGGLDSGVTALLAHRALGSRLTCVFVDTGLLRANDVAEFSAYYKSAGLNLQILDAGERVLAALKGLVKPDKKREALQETLRVVLNEAIGKLDYQLLVESQSSDYLFSGKQKADNRSLIDDPPRRVAPLSDLFKEEIRLVGEALGMPQDLTGMQPFPWTGLALRIVGECSAEKLALLRWADERFQDEIRDAGLQRKLWKYFAVLYEVPHQLLEQALVIALRAVSISHSGSDLRAIPARLPYDLLERFTEQVMAHEPKVSKVIYDLTPGVSPQETEWQ